ncbi:S9 family peptidase [Microbacterium rhizomatis]|uniref:S9 family peptidase n=1 Tax=Microbacterium rhizomatis TaxID=1631477 RepID=A0A5J5IYR5_9MICO|nr:S9 family peptidase [Microbacterium rhizomatis]KAA9106565.1 S9 family peptidase [Microbacterium rhizomatis]
MTTTLPSTGTAPVRPHDLEEIWTPSTVRREPGSRRVLIAESRPDSTANAYVSRLLLHDLAPENAADPVQIDGGPGVRLAAFAPEGGELAWVRTREGRSVIRHVSTAGRGSALTDGIRDIAELPDAIEELAWSPSAARLAVVARVPVDREWFEAPEDRRAPLRITTLRYSADGIGWTVNNRRQIFVVDVATGEVRCVSDATADDHDVAWTPDEKGLLFTSQRQPDWDLTEANALHRLDLATGEIATITDATREIVRPVPSADGTRVATVAVDIAHYPSTSFPALVDLTSGAVTDLRAIVDRDCTPGSIRWVSPDAFVVLVGSEGRIEVVEITCAAGGAPTARTLLTGPRQITGFDVHDGLWVAIESSPTTPPRVIVGEEGAASRVLHDPNAQYREGHRLAEPRHEPVDVDGTTIDSWIATPDGEGPHPLIIWLQGGGTQYGYQWSHEVHTLIGQGFAVAWLNPRGSAGYGTAWMKVNAAPGAAEPGEGWGNRDLDDIVAVVQHLLATHPVDSARVGVMGGSYGGMMTAFLLAKTDLFAAGWAERGCYNLFSDAATKDEAPWFFEKYLGVSHLQDATPYWDASPLKYVDGITAPLAIVHSEYDRRCAIQQAEELFFALRVLGRPAEFIRFPGEGHSLTREGTPVHRRQRGDLLLEWFGETLSA